MLKYILLFFTIIIFLLWNIKGIESFENVNYTITNNNQFTDHRFQIYNQNHNKKWKNDFISHNSPIVQTFGTSFNDMYKMNQYIFNDFKKDQLDDFVKNNSQKFDAKNFLKAYTPFDIYNINKDTWYNRYNWDPNYTLYQKYIVSKFKEINDINKLFLHKFNKFWFDYIGNYVKRKTILYKPFFIMKYRLVELLENPKKKNEKPESKVFEVVLVITRDDAYLAFEFFLRGLFVLENDEYVFKKMAINYIGNYSLDQLLLRKNLNKYNTEFNLNPLWKNNDQITSAEAKKIFAKGKEEVRKERDFLDNSYACFTYDKKSKDPFSRPIYAIDKNDCEDAYNMIGYQKPSGVWDKPCNDDSQCMFFKGNKNYDNNYGRCINGKCQLPLNMKNLGYHYYINTDSAKPLCYNCKSDRWLPNTELGFCCDEQKNDRKKYPFLKSPDYAFQGDSLDRYNNFVQKKCVMKPKYDNIFKDTNVWEVECDGFLNSYLIKS